MEDKRKIIKFILKNVNYFEDDSLMNGKTSLIFTLAILEKYMNEPAYYKLIEKLIHSVYTSLSNRTVLTTYCHGLAGIGWALNYLSSKLILNYDFTDLLESIDETLIQQIKQIENNSSFYLDFLHGEIGIGYYLLSRKKKESYIIVDSILKNAVVDINGDCYWINPNQSNPLNYINLGAAHGIAATINFLIRFQESFDYRELEVKNVLKGSVNFLIKISKFDNFSVFPNNVDKNFEGNYHSRIAWCHGDLGISFCLLKYSLIYNDTRVNKFALKILRKCSEKTEYSKNGINDTSFCHGTSGAFAFFSLLSYKYGFTEFENVADFWYNETIHFRNGLQGIRKFRSFENHKYYKDLGIISGLCGIILALISKDDRTQLSHLEELFMI